MRVRARAIWISALHDYLITARNKSAYLVTSSRLFNTAADFDF